MMLRTYHPLQSSPVGEYIVSYLQASSDGDLNAENSLWENRVLVSASSPREALEKVFERFSRDGDLLPTGRRFSGFTSIVPIHEKLGDLVEIEWFDHSGLVDGDHLDEWIAGATVDEACARFDRVNDDEALGLPRRCLSSWTDVSRRG